MQWFLNPESKMFRGRKAALDEIQNSGKYSRDEIRKFKFIIPDEKRQNYDWNDNDPSVPIGWLTTIITMNSFGKMVKSKRFMAPCGRFCSSRDDAIKYMLKDGLYTDEEIDIMQSGFGMGEDNEYDDMNTGGWEMDDDGNVGTVQISADRPKFFGDWAHKEVDAEKRKWEIGETSPEGEPSKRARLDSDDENQIVDYKDFVPSVRITKVKSESSSQDDDFQLRSWRTGKRIARSQVKEEDEEYEPAQSSGKDEGWIDNDDSVPRGWKTKEYTNKGGQKVKNMMAPDGTFCAGRKSALEYMESRGNCNSDDLELMQSGLKSVAWTDDDSTVPDGNIPMTIDQTSFMLSF